MQVLMADHLSPLLTPGENPPDAFLRPARGTERVRPIRREDIPQICDLYATIFRPGRAVRRDAVENALARTYLTSPGDLIRPASLVDTDDDGNVQGFMGIITLSAWHGTKPLRGGIMGNFMAREANRAKSAIRLAIATNQQDLDFIFTDTANRISIEIGKGFRYVMLPLNSLEWVKVLRPAETVGYLLGRRVPGLRPVLAPGARLIDRGASRLAFAATPAPDRKDILDRAIGATDFAATAPALIARFAIRPDWNPAEIGWLLAQASLKTRNGALHIRAVTAGGKTIGLYLLYAKAGAAAHALQVLTHRNHEPAVFGALFRTAHALGAVAVRGTACSTAVEGLARQHGILYHHVAATQVFSRDPALKEAFTQSNVCAGGLFGEGWTQLSTEVFD